MKRAAIVLLVAIALPHAAAAQTPTPAPAGPAVEAAAAILIDLRTDDVLFARSVHARRAPASLTKVVTALVARERYALDEIVRIGPLAAKIHGSRLGVEEGMTFTVRDLLYALMLDSGNDAANALAEHNPGGYRHFVALLNEKARSLGAFETRFVNPHGLDEPGHHSSAWDMAIFGRHLMADPLLASIVRTPRYEVPWPDGRTRSITNHNKLIGSHPGATGVKTGFTNQAGRSLLAAEAVSGNRLLSVVLSATDQYEETKSLFAYGATRIGRPMARLGPPPPAPAAEGVPAPVPEPITDSRTSAPYRWAALMAVLAAAMLATLHRSRALPEATWRLEPTEPSPDTSPVRVRERVGTS